MDQMHSLYLPLKMSRDEDRAFNCINSKPSTFLKHCASGAKRFTAERQFVPRMSQVLRNGEHDNLSEVVSSARGKKRHHYIPERLTKIVALRKDLVEHRMTEPQLRAVVFTQHLEVHDTCVRGLEQDGFDVYQFTGSSDSNKRDAAIRNFQNTASQRPAVFVITLRSGNVGITFEGLEKCA